MDRIGETTSEPPTPMIYVAESSSSCIALATI